MKKLIIAAMVSLSVLFGFSGLALAAAPGLDASRTEVCNGLQGGACDANTAGNDISRVIRAVLVILSWVAGVAAIIMIVIAGLKYITSGGDSSSISSAKQALIYALVGVVIVALSQFLVRYVLGQVVAP